MALYKLKVTFPEQLRFIMHNLTEQSGLQDLDVVRWTANSCENTADIVAIEEPLEMQIAFGKDGSRTQQPMSITMRTPGQDADLFAGFLFTEGIISAGNDIMSMHTVGPGFGAADQANTILAELSPNLNFDPSKLSRNFYTTSSCGVCGKTSIDLVETVSCYMPKAAHPQVLAHTLATLPDVLLNEQSLFEHTGGIHAAGLFSTDGELQLLREDVGRHNALDKLIGAALQRGMLPLHDYILLLSGRISFELVQKAAMAGIPIIGAVGAPSSLAIDLATERGITLAGFIRPQRMNIYCSPERILTKG